MTLAKLLFEPTLVRSPIRIVQWWERRRLLYNAIVGGAGLVSLAVVQGVELAFGNGWLPVPFLGIVAYGLAANVCYTGGWVIENLVERVLKRPVYGLGPALFRHGLTFSLGLTLLPAAMITAANILGRLFAP